MPSKLPRVSGEDTIRALKRLGFVPARQRGSHIVLKKQIQGEEIGCVVPMYNEIATGTLRSILRQAGVTVEEFIENL
jgi:predicted RNA binding protein YcfA (HicA-like mRNA interferase family)